MLLPYNVIAFHGWTQWDGPKLLTPYGRLVSEPDGSYSLFGTVIVPGNGLLIRQLIFSLPSGPTLPAAFFPVQIVLGVAEPSAAKGFLMVRMPLDFRATGSDALPVGGHTGMNHVALIVMLETAAVGTAVIQVPELSWPILPDVTMIPPCEKWGWVTWRTKSFSSVPPMRVQGYFEAESFGYIGELAVAVPQGIDQDELVLRLTFRAVEGIHARVKAKIPVQYLDPNPPRKYQRVLILYPSEAACQIPVTELGC